MITIGTLRVVIGVLFVLTLHTNAQKSLYIPGFDSQPISADVAGVDSEGRTTWLLHQGKATGTFDPSEGDFPGTATLVEGDKDLSFTYAFSTFTLGSQCTFSANLAICTGTDQSGTLATESDVVSLIGVQVGTTLISQSTTSSSPAATASSSSSSSINSRSSSGSLPSATSNGSASGAANPTTSTTSSAIAERAPLAAVAITVLIAMGML